MKKLLMVLAICSSGYVMAQDSSNQNWKSGDEATHFIKKAARADLMEIKAGQMARDQGSSTAVKSYGEMMVRDHTTSWNELKAMADRRNIQLPAMDRTDMNANMGGTSGTWMGASSTSYLSGDAANTARNGENRSRIRSTANMRLSKAQTTPSKRYQSGQATGWTDRDVIAGTSSTSWTSNAGASSSRSMAASGTATSSSSRNNSIDAGAIEEPALSGTQNTSEEAGVASAGTLGVSGTTGTLTANADFNGATMYTDSTATGTAGTIQSTATGTATSSSAMIDSDQMWVEIDREHQSKLESLKGKTGAEFDRAYANMMSSDHSQAIQLYEKASQSSDAEIKAFASKMLPILRQHQEAAKNMSNTVNTGL